VAGAKNAFEFCDGPLPVPPGSSPFGIKGEFYRHLQSAARRYKESGKGDVLARCSPEIRAFAEQSFLSFEYYDLLPFPRIGMAEAEVLGRDLRQHTYDKARKSGERAASGVYKLMLRLMSVQSLASKTAHAIEHMYNFAPATITTEGKSRLLIQRKGVPLGVIEWWCIVTKAYIEVALATGGVKDAKVTHQYEQSGAIDRGVPLGNAVVDVQW
jgi:hypothetical protein